MKNPTEEADAELRSAYAFFNAELFAGPLAGVLDYLSSQPPHLRLLLWRSLGRQRRTPGR